MKLTDIHPHLSLPNLITGTRFITAPVMLWLAWHGYGVAFMGVLAIAFFSDLLDGTVARLTGQMSQFGVKLDSWADLLTYITIGFGSWWLWPDIVHREDAYLYIILACFLIPATTASIKFDRYPSYHTWAVKIAAASIGLSLYPLFLADIAWPFHIAVVIYVFAAIEELAITLALKKLKSNVRTIWHVLRQR
jgi:CDP-diacylglycerol--glycerol-3-phosphate 3-phosphatidyltransferase